MEVNLNEKKRIVIKVGTSSLTYKTGNLNIRKIEELIKTFADIRNSGRDVIFVTSGAVGVGAGLSGLREKPKDMPTKQACAAIGQCELMNMYSREFSKYNRNVAQMLLTRSVISNPERKTNARNTLHRLLEMGVVPIINANDSVSIEQLDFDENDTLSATVAELADADLLVILTDVAGLYDRNPKLPDAKLIRYADRVTQDMINAAGEKGSEMASGGMKTKLEAANMALDSGITTAIMCGDDPALLYDLLENKAICTIFDNGKDRI